MKLVEGMKMIIKKNEMKRFLKSLKSFDHGALLMDKHGEMVASGEKEIQDWIDNNEFEAKGIDHAHAHGLPLFFPFCKTQ